MAYAWEEQEGIVIALREYVFLRFGPITVEGFSHAPYFWGIDMGKVSRLKTPR